MLQFKCDLQVDNFVRFFEHEVVKMTVEQRERLPSDIVSRLFRKNGTLTTNRLNFLQQLFILSRGLNDEIYVMVKRPDGELNLLDFEKFQKSLKKRKLSQEEAEHYLGRGVFVVSSNELIDWMGHLNAVSLSPAYNYALRIANTKDPNLPTYEKEFIYFTNLLSNYEGNKKKIIKTNQLDIPEWYILLYLCDGKEKGSRAVYENVYKDAVTSSRQTILNAFKKLLTRGYIQTFGKTNNVVYKITTLGKEEVKKIIKKYVVP